MNKVLTVVISIFILSLFSTLNSQVDRAGTIVKVSNAEIIVRNENPSAPFVMGETLRLLTGDKTVVLQVTFAMQASAKCKLISGSIGSLKAGSLVYSGGMPESSGGDTVKSAENSNVKSMKIDDFQKFLGFTNGDTMEKAVSILGEPTVQKKGNGSPMSLDILRWRDTIESNCDITVMSEPYSADPGKIQSIDVSSRGYSNYIDTSKCGSIHFLRSKGIDDACFGLFGSPVSEIKKIFGEPDDTQKYDSVYSYWYETSDGGDVVFSFFDKENILHSIHVFFPGTVESNIVMDIDCIAKTYLEVYLDGKKTFSGIYTPGTKKTWSASEQIQIKIGNAGGVNCKINGKEYSFGMAGQVASKVVKYVKDKVNGNESRIVVEDWR